MPEREHSIYSLTHWFTGIFGAEIQGQKERCTMPQSVDFGSSLPGFKSQLCHLLAVGPEASDMASLICLICKMGAMMVITSQRFCEDKMDCYL